MGVLKVICEICNKEISKSNYSKHLRRHQNHPETFEKPFYAVKHDGLACQYCGKMCKNKNSLGNHERLCRENPNGQESYFIKYNSEHEAWNKGLTKETDERVASLAESISISTAGKHKHKQSEETKNKISNSMKKYLSDNPDKVPYVRNHSSKTSYPEKYFIDTFKKLGIDLKYHLQVGKYELDFYNLEKMVDVEIDGEQHYLDKRIIQSDIERTQWLSDNGWTTYRIRWSEYKKLSDDGKQGVIHDILLLLE